MAFKKNISRKERKERNEKTLDFSFREIFYPRFSTGWGNEDINVFSLRPLRSLREIFFILSSFPRRAGERGISAIDQHDLRPNYSYHQCDSTRPPFGEEDSLRWALH